MGSWISYSQLRSYFLVWRCPGHVDLWLKWVSPHWAVAITTWTNPLPSSAKTESVAWGALCGKSPTSKNATEVPSHTAPCPCEGTRSLTPTTSYTICRAQCQMKMWSSLFRYLNIRTVGAERSTKCGTLCTCTVPHPLLLTPGLGTFCSKLRACVLFLVCRAIRVRNTKSVLRTFSRIQALSFT